MKNQCYAKKVFLLSRSVSLHNMPSVGVYDAKIGLNVCINNGNLIPTILSAGRLGTESKTFAAPGDDDPDMDAEICY